MININEPIVTILEPGRSDIIQKPAKCVMSMDTKLRKVEPDVLPRQLFPIDQNTPLPCCKQSNSRSTCCKSLNDAGKHLMRACAEGYLDEVEDLLNRGAAFLSDWLGTTPLHIAAQHNYPKIVQRLLIGGISKDCRNKVERTALHVAADLGHLDVVKVLVARGANINCLDMLNMTPLHWAVQNGHYDVVKFLLSKGLKPNYEYRNKFKLTPMDIALQINRQDIVELLKTALEAPIDAIEKLNTHDGMDFLAIDSSNMMQDHTLEERLHYSDEPTSLDDPIIDIIDDIEFKPEPKIQILHSQTIPPPLQQIKGTDTTTFLNKNEASSNKPPLVGHQHKVNILRKPSNASKPNQNQLNNNALNGNNGTKQAKNDDNDAIRLLQQHLMSTDDVEEMHILDKAIENGHSVVLTDAGKEILKSIEHSEDNTKRQESRKILTVTPEQFLQMMNGNRKMFKNNVKVLSAHPPAKRMVMNKNKFVAKTSNISTLEGKITESNQKSASRMYSQEDMDVIVNQLVEAKKSIEEYKLKLLKKEQEAERYKKQLRLLMDLS